MTLFQASLLIVLGYILSHFVAAVKLEYKSQRFEQKLKQDLKTAINQEKLHPTVIAPVGLIPTVVTSHTLQSMEGEVFELYIMSDGTTRWYLPAAPNRVD